MDSSRCALMFYLVLLLSNKSAVASELTNFDLSKSAHQGSTLVERSEGSEGSEGSSQRTEGPDAGVTSTEQATTIEAGYRAAYKYTGNSFSMKFHRPSCPFAKAMWRCNVVRFPFRKDAIERGYKPCKYCLPQSWKSVGAKILRATPLSENGESLIESGTSPSCKEAASDRLLESTQSSKSATDEAKR